MLRLSILLSSIQILNFRFLKITRIPRFYVALILSSGRYSLCQSFTPDEYEPADTQGSATVYATLFKTLAPLPPHPLTLTTKLCLKISNLHFSFCCLKVTPDSLFVMDKHPEFRNIVIGAGFSGNIEGTNGYFIYMCFRAVVWLFIRDNCIHVITVNQWQTQNKFNNEGIGLDRIFICLFVFKSDQKRISPQNVKILSNRRLVKGKEKNHQGDI